MKILKGAFISFLAAVLVLTVALIIFVKTFDINRFKPQIIGQAGDALGRKVDFEKAQLALSFRQGISLRVSHLVVADDPSFTQGDFFAAKDISLSIDLLGYLFHKRIGIGSVLIDGFRVTIIRQKDGRLNLQSIAQTSGSKSKEQKPEEPPGPMALPAILISSFKGSNGEVAYLDHATEPPAELKVSDLNFVLSKISLTEKFPFTFEGRVLSSTKNIRVEGKAQVNLGTNELTLSELKGETDLSQILLEKIPASFPVVQGAVLPVSLKGTAQINLERMTAGPKGMTELAGDIVLNDGLLQFTQMALPLKDVRLRAKFTQVKITLDVLSATLGKGSIKGAGSLDDYLTGQEFSMALDANNISLEDLFSRDTLPVKARGVASGQMQFKGRGFTSQALSSALSGTGILTLKNVVLKDINVFQGVMNKLSMIPGLAERSEAAVPERYKQGLAEKDTPLSDMEFPFNIENGLLIIKDAVLSAEMFSLKSSVKVDFDGSYAMEGSFSIPSDLSLGLATKVLALQYLLNEDKQILIPLKVSGKAAGAALNVDARYIAQRLFTNQAKTQLLQVIDKVTGEKALSETPSSDAQGANDKNSASGEQTEDPNAKQTSLKDLAGSILGDILKK